MSRKGQQLEDWAAENIKGTPTVNSGATFEDADMKVGGVGGRLYEFKSSEDNMGLSINRVAARTLLQRAIKLNREPVFIYQNAAHKRFALMPLKILQAALGKWKAVEYYPTPVQAVMQAMQQAPLIQSKGDNIRIKDWELKGAMEHNGFLLFQTKNTIVWAVLEADAWLDVGDDKKNPEKSSD